MAHRSPIRAFLTAGLHVRAIDSPAGRLLCRRSNPRDDENAAFKIQSLGILCNDGKLGPCKP
jgi:hypothetical protein